MLTKKDLESIHERYKNATEGEWKNEKDSSSRFYNVRTGGGSITAYVPRKEDAVFIANAKKDILNLIHEIENLCPVGDLDIFTSLRVENRFLSECLEEKNKIIKLLIEDVQKIKAVTDTY